MDSTSTSLATTPTGCVSTQSQIRVSKAGFENRVSTTQLLKKKRHYAGSNPLYHTVLDISYLLTGSLPTDSATETLMKSLGKGMFYLLGL